MIFVGQSNQYWMVIGLSVKENNYGDAVGNDSASVLNRWYRTEETRYY